MPWYYRRRRTRWRRPRRRLWRRRFRKTFRSTFRRRRYRVRPRKYRKKLRKITLKEYQPETIKRLKIKGINPLFITTNERRTNNVIQWLFSRTPHYFPGGGGFSITQYTLAGLYELHDKCLNWWTQSNCTLPLIRYMGAKFKLYRSQTSDYVFRYLKCYPMKSTQLLYMSMHPSMMMMNYKTIFVRCIDNTKHKKPYKTIFVRPPSQMQTKWYFQTDLANIPLVATLATAASFERYYLPANANSITIGFKSLNTKIFIYHNFQNYPTTGYIPKDKMYLYGLQNGQTDITKIKVGDLTYLAAPGTLKPGDKIRDGHDNTDTTFEQQWTKYFSNSKYWGNPFMPEWFTQEKRVIYTNKSPSELKAALTQSITMTMDTLIGNNFTEFHDPFFYEIRYNPLDDTGTDSSTYLVPNIRDQTDWSPLNNKNLKVEGYPAWLTTFGWIDWQKFQAEAQQIDINYITVLTNKFMWPKLDYYVPLDENFFTNTSPYRPEAGDLTLSDRQHFYPKGTFQLQALNTIGSSGPGIVKLPPGASTEAHVEYKLYFKLGGCPAKLDKICDPADQPRYPIPNNIDEPNSLQNPTTPPEYFIYAFDERRGTLTKKAAQRMLTDFQPKEPTFLPTGTKLQLPVKTHQETSTSEETSDSEEEKTTLQQQLDKQRRQQRKLRLQIKRLLKLNKNL
nr:MAG: ORF1 [TTV-like mini virus]